jgi:thiol-disulfide isomerase/thioredoxin
LSNGIDAFISRITAAGPSAKRPPHMELEPDVRSLIALSFVVSLGLLGGCDRQSPSAPQAGGNTQAAGPAETIGNVDISKAGTSAPGSAFTDPQDRPATLAQFRGKPLMLNLWATWCGPCVREMPTLDALAGREKGRFRLITISQDMQGRSVVAPWFAQRKFVNLEPGLDQKNDLMFALGTDTLPTTIFYDASGKEMWRVTGAMDWSGERARTLIEGALNPPG